MNKSAAYIVPLVGVALVLLYLWEDSKRREKARDEIRQYYSQEISGIVSTVSQNRGTITLRLMDKKDGAYYFRITRNYNLSPYDLHEFLQHGDSVHKSPNSNELFIFRDEKKYRFDLDLNLNR